MDGFYFDFKRCLLEGPGLFKITYFVSVQLSRIPIMSSLEFIAITLTPSAMTASILLTRLGCLQERTNEFVTKIIYMS